EVSIDGGATWHQAQGTAVWSYIWSPGTLGATTIRSRAIDDSGNMETAGSGVAGTVGAGIFPCTSLWRPTNGPTATSGGDTNETEVGVKFRSDVAGFITGVRFYKGTMNTGTHVANLWSLSGARLATEMFRNETPTGWQQVNFPAPVPIAANTTYVASYHTN